MNYKLPPKNLLLNQAQLDIKNFFIFSGITLLAIFLGANLIKFQTALLIFALILGLASFLLTLINTDFGITILIFSMLFSPELKVAQVPQRAVVIRIDDILLFLVFFAWMAKVAINKKLGLLRHTPLNRPMIFYILACVFTTIIGILRRDIGSFPKSSFYILKYTEYFILYFLVSNHLSSYSQAKRFIIFFLITGFLVCLYGFSQIGKVERISAPFEGIPEPNTLGGYLLFLFSISAGLFLYTRHFLHQLLLLGLCLSIIPPFIYTLSRGSYFAFLGMYLALMFFSKRKRLFLILGFIIGLIILPQVMPKIAIQRITQTFVPGKKYYALGKEITLDPSASERIETWKRVLERWREKPLLGYGVTGIGFVDSQIPLVLGEAGILGLWIFFWLLITIFKYAFKTYQNVEDNWSKGLSLGFLAGYIGLIFHFFSASTFIIIRIMEPFWFVAAVVMMLPKLTKKE